MQYSTLVDRARTIAGTMRAGVVDPATQLVQTRFRMSLVDGWGLVPGSTVLEIGCGQGDMTVVLADAVGPHGRIVAVDIAPRSYGSPVTVGASADHLLAGPLGDRIEFHFDFDVLSASFPDDAFDAVVLSQCSWYFASLDELRRTLAAVRPWARRLCFAEWSLRPRSAGQLPHLLAVLLQGQLEAAGARGDGNVRTPFSREALLRLLPAAGWLMLGERLIDTAGLQDADWEISACLNLVNQRLDQLPVLARDFVNSQVDVLRSVALRSGNEALPVYVVSAFRG
jgi:SAM-dependent methyltransferase